MIIMMDRWHVPIGVHQVAETKTSDGSPVAYDNSVAFFHT